MLFIKTQTHTHAYTHTHAHKSILSKIMFFKCLFEQHEKLNYLNTQERTQITQNYPASKDAAIIIADRWPLKIWVVFVTIVQTWILNVVRLWFTVNRVKHWICDLHLQYSSYFLWSSFTTLLPVFVCCFGFFMLQIIS